MFTVNSKAIAAAAVCSAVKDVRYYLNSVYVEPLSSGDGARITATDGHRLVIVTDTEGTCDAPAIVSFDKAALTKMKAKGAGNVTVTRLDDETIIAKIAGIDHISGVELIDATFPDVDRVVPDSLPEESFNAVAFNAHYMAGFCEVAKILDISGSAVSFVNGPTGNESICVLFGGSRINGLHARGVLMPLREVDMPWKA